MENERIEGTILIDIRPDREPHVHGGHVFAGCTLPGVLDVQVDYAGEITYAVTDAGPDRMWWFAGIGNVNRLWWFAGIGNVKESK